MDSRAKESAEVERASRKRRVLLPVLITAVVLAGLFAFFSFFTSQLQPRAQLNADLTWTNYVFSRDFNSSYVFVEGTIFNPTSVTAENASITIRVYVHYICHHDLNHQTLVKTERIDLGSILGNASKTLKAEIPYPYDDFYSFRYVDYDLLWAR